MPGQEHTMLLQKRPELVRSVQEEQGSLYQANAVRQTVPDQPLLRRHSYGGEERLWKNWRERHHEA